MGYSKSSSIAPEYLYQPGDMKFVPLPVPTGTEPMDSAGWLLMNSRAVVRTAYSNLYNKVKLMYGKTVGIINTTLETIEVVGHGYSTGNAITMWSSDTMPAPLTEDTVYYVRVLTVDTMTLHPTALDATNNTNVINLTSAGTGTKKVWLSTTFPLPDGRGLHLRTNGTHGTLKDAKDNYYTGGENGQYYSDQTQNHNHAGTYLTKQVTWSDGGGISYGGSGFNFNQRTITIDAPTANATADTGTPRMGIETRSASFTAWGFIKT